MDQQLTQQLLQYLGSNYFLTMTFTTLTKIISVSKPGTPSETFERKTWPELARLASEMPEAGVHFQGMSGEYVRSRYAAEML